MSITNPKHRSGETISGKWHLDPRRSRVEFHVGHVWGLKTVGGHFDDYKGQLDLSTNPAIELTIDAASVQRPPLTASSRSKRPRPHTASWG
jgi:polyisoprenoid-binding protein YceI